MALDHTTSQLAVSLFATFCLGCTLRPTLLEAIDVVKRLSWSGLYYVAEARARQFLKFPPRPVVTFDAKGYDFGVTGLGSAEAENEVTNESAGPAPFSSDDLLYHLQRDGCVCVKNLFSTALVDQIHTELDLHFASETKGIGGSAFGGGGEDQTGRIGNLMTKSPTVRDKVVLNNLLLGTVEKVLLRVCKKISFKVTEVIRMLPGGKARQALHVEEGQWPVTVGMPVGEDISIDCMVAVTDFTKENGATHIVPGSNLWYGRGRLDGTGRVDNSRPTIQAEMPRGSVLFFTGSLVHAGGRNTTQKPRVGLVLGFQAGFLRPEANHYLSVPPAHARELPAPIQELLGYPLRYTPVSKPGKYEAVAGSLAYRAAGAYAYNGGPEGQSRLVPYAGREEVHHSY